jgi:hypothetical protein
MSGWPSDAPCPAAEAQAQLRYVPDLPRWVLPRLMRRWVGGQGRRSRPACRRAWRAGGMSGLWAGDRGVGLLARRGCIGFHRAAGHGEGLEFPRRPRQRRRWRRLSGSCRRRVAGHGSSCSARLVPWSRGRMRSGPRSSSWRWGRGRLLGTRAGSGWSRRRSSPVLHAWPRRMALGAWPWWIYTDPMPCASWIARRP